MNKTYIDLEELEKVFSELDIPYTNVFDEVYHLSADEIAAELPAFDLSKLLRDKEDTVAVQIWSERDIIAAIEGMGILPNDEMISQVKKEARGVLSNCEDNWDKLRTVIRQVLEEEE